MKKNKKRLIPILLTSVVMGISMFPKAGDAAESINKTINCYTTTSGAKTCQNSSSVSGYGSNLTFSQTNNIQQYGTYFKYNSGRFDFTVKSGNPFISRVWVDVKTSGGTGAKQSYNAVEKRFLKGYSSFSFDMKGVPSYYLTSGSLKGYAGQSTVEVASDILATTADVGVVYNFITYPRKN